MAILCPGCRQPLEAGDVQCPVCLRSRSPREIARAIREQDPAYLRKRFLGARSTKVMAAGLCILGFAYLGNKKDFFPRTRLYDFAMNALKRGTDTSPPPAPPAAPAKKHPQEPPPPPPPEVLYKVNELGFIDVGPNPPPAAGAEPPLPGQTPPPPPQAPKPKEDKRWLVQGKVYDLLTLKPVAGAKISFVAKRRGRYSAAVTRADGSYSLRLDPSQYGYEVEFSHPRYGSLYMEEAAPPYRERSVENRRLERDAMHSSQIVHLPFMLEGAKRTITHDLVVSEQ